MKTLLRVLLALVPAVYFVLFALDNDAPTTLYFRFMGAAQGASWVVILCAVLFGAALTTIAFTWPLVRVRLRLRRESKRVAQLEQEVHGLRTLPLSQDDEAKATEAREA